MTENGLERKVNGTPVSKNVMSLLELQYVPVAAEAVNKGDYDIARGALEHVLEDTGQAERYGEAFMLGTFATKEGIQTATKVLSGDYNKVAQSSKVLDLINYLKLTSGFKLTEHFSQHELRVLSVRLLPYKDKTLGDMNKEMAEAQKIIDMAKSDQGHNVTEMHIQKAYEIMALYGRVTEVISTLTDANTILLTQKATEMSNENYVKDVKQRVLG